jgi:hypothetical protein
VLLIIGVFVTETEYVYCAVRTESLNTFQVISVEQRLNLYASDELWYYVNRRDVTSLQQMIEIAQFAFAVFGHRSGSEAIYSTLLFRKFCTVV